MACVRARIREASIFAFPRAAGLDRIGEERRGRYPTHAFGRSEGAEGDIQIEAIFANGTVYFVRGSLTSDGWLRAGGLHLKAAFVCRLVCGFYTNVIVHQVRSVGVDLSRLVLSAGAQRREAWQTGFRDPLTSCQQHSCVADIFASLYLISIHHVRYYLPPLQQRMEITVQIWEREKVH